MTTVDFWIIWKKGDSVRADTDIGREAEGQDADTEQRSTGTDSVRDDKGTGREREDGTTRADSGKHLQPDRLPTDFADLVAALPHAVAVVFLSHLTR